MVKIKHFYRGRRGFSLIEVIIALAIFMVVVIALEFSYYSYYRNITDLRIKTIGQNLAELQLEDIQNLASSVIVSHLVDNAAGYSPNYPPDDDGDYTNNVYDSGVIKGSFRIEGLKNICGESGGSLPSDLLLPSSIEFIYDTTTTYYTLVLHKEVFPHYKKRIVITDETPSVKAPAKKIFKLEVTTYWGKDADNDGIPDKYITVTGEKSDAGSG